KSCVCPASRPPHPVTRGPPCSLPCAICAPALRPQALLRPRGPPPSGFSGPAAPGRTAPPPQPGAGGAAGPAPPPDPPHRLPLAAGPVVPSAPQRQQARTVGQQAVVAAGRGAAALVQQLQPAGIDGHG